MKKYVLDTNIYIAAARDADFGLELVQFAGSFLPQLYLHAVVVQELARGAVSERARRRLEHDVVEPFEKRGRIVVPTYAAWKRSGEIAAALVKRRRSSVGGVPASFMNDILLATSCRDQGITVITLNASDFQRISGVEQIAFQAPWPRG